MHLTLAEDALGQGLLGAGHAQGRAHVEAQIADALAETEQALDRAEDALLAVRAEVAQAVGKLLQVTNFDLAAGLLTFYRPKVDKAQTHKLTADTLRAMQAWIGSPPGAGDAPAMGPLRRGSRKGGALTAAGMTERAITARVGVLGDAIGIAGLSAHDCHHAWAGKMDLFRLQAAGGWHGLAMPWRYTEWAAVANDGMA